MPEGLAPELKSTDEAEIVSLVNVETPREKISQPTQEQKEFETPTGAPGRSQIRSLIQDTPSGEQLVSLSVAAKTAKASNESWDEYKSDGQFLNQFEGKVILAEVRAKRYRIDHENGYIRFTGLENITNEPALSKEVAKILVEDYRAKYRALSEILEQF